MINPWRSLRRALIPVAVLGFFACQGEQSPLSPIQDGTPAFVEVNGVKLVTIAPGRGLEPADDDEVKKDVSNSQGATLKASGATLVILPNSMSQSYAEVEMRAEYESGFVQFRFGPSGLAFTPAATLTVSAAKANKFGINLSGLRIAGASDSGDDWQLVGGVYDPLTDTVTAQISHFSRYALCVE